MHMNADAQLRAQHVRWNTLLDSFVMIYNCHMLAKDTKLQRKTFHFLYQV